MQKDFISSRNAVCLFYIMVISNNIILGFPDDVGPDLWISFLLSLLMVIPLVLVYARLVKLMPGKDIYDMAEYVFGKIGARIVCFLFGFFCLHQTALMFGNNAEFIHLTSLFQTPFIVIVLVLCLSCLYLAKSGIETLGKWCAAIAFLGACTLVSITLFSLPYMEASNLKPVLAHSAAETFIASAKLVPLPFGESVVILGLIGGIEKNAKPKRVMVLGAIISTFFLLVIFVRACGIFGAETMATIYFPNYKASSVIQIGDFLERIEALLAFVYLLCGIGKASACLISATKGAAKLFNVSDYRHLILPVGALAAAFSVILFHNIVEMFDFIAPFLIYAIPFEILIPLVLWIGAEIKTKLNQGSQSSKEKQGSLQEQPSEA